eukprot:4285414-Pyramimonas_sp.AAC.1
MRGRIPQCREPWRIDSLCGAQSPRPLYRGSHWTKDDENNDWAAHVPIALFMRTRFNSSSFNPLV